MYPICTAMPSVCRVLHSVLQAGSHICQRPPEEEMSHAEVVSQEVLHCPLFYRQLSQAAAENL